MTAILLAHYVDAPDKMQTNIKSLSRQLSQDYEMPMVMTTAVP
jgi:hypothetical protein